jgi:electron transfer flavoprotein beta subunit
MYIVVCVKQVPDTTQVRIDPETNTLRREGVPFIVNPFDTHAIEESLRLKDQFGFRVAAISMGPPNAEYTLRKAYSMGVDEVVLLSDRAFGGADTLATSNVLTEAIKKLSEKDEIPLIICGRQTIDGDTAQVGPGIATRLKYNQLTLVDKVEDIDIKNKKITVRRKLEGRYEIVESTLPALLTVVREINKPRYPRVPLRLLAEEITVPMWDNKVLNLPEDTIGLKGSPTRVVKIFSPEREKGEILGDGLKDPEGAAKLLIEKLLSKELLPF